MKPYLTFIIPFLVTYFSTPLVRNIAVRFKILDLPEDRKVHKVATPLLGGIAIYLGVFIGVLFSLSNLRPFLPILIGGVFILILGLIDDIIKLNAQLRLVCQSLIALAVIRMGVRVSFLPVGFWGDILEVVVTVLWIVGVTNAYNYLDGLNGLAAGSVVINLFCFTIILYKTGQYPLALMSIIVVAACLGFLPYNFKKAKIFLGETGSTFLGFSLACIAVVGNWAGDNIVKLSIPILILGVPIFDMIFTTGMRVKEGKIKTLLEWLEYGGKDHFHHYLVDLGLQTFSAVIFIYFITLSLGLSAIMVSNDLAMEAFLTLSQASIIFGIIATLIVVGKKRRSGWS